MSYELQMAGFFQPMRDELTAIGFQELRTPEEVEALMAGAGGKTVLMFINSMCGCAGGIARPAAKMALEQAKKKPDILATVFASQDKLATAQVRSYIKGYPPSSPSITLFKDGQVVAMIERHQIENRDPRAVASDLVAAMEKHCG